MTETATAPPPTHAELQHWLGRRVTVSTLPSVTLRFHPEADPMPKPLGAGLVVAVKPADRIKPRPYLVVRVDGFEFWRYPEEVTEAA